MVNLLLHACWFYALSATIHFRRAWYTRTGGEIIITSQERREGRYQRRKAKREAKKLAKMQKYDDYESVFTYDNLYHSYKMCVKDVGWKPSIQKYKARAPLEVYENYERLMNRTFTHDNFYEFNIVERGKKRHIRSVTVRERVVQRCLCDYSLVPAVTSSFIYDNGASMKDKGYTFAIKRMETHLHQYYRKYGNEGYILLYDFSKFFDRVSHSVIQAIIDKTYTDEELKWIVMHFVSAFGDIGLGLGSQISQVLALASANELDHFVKEKLRIKYYGRYMDDGYLIHHDKKYLAHCLEEIQLICDKLGIVLNRKKTKIAKLSRGFVFLKVRFYLTDSGKVVKKIYKRSIVKMRRKLKAFRRFVDDGIMTMEDVEMSMQSWTAYASNFDAYYAICNMKALYTELFGNFKGGKR